MGHLHGNICPRTPRHLGAPQALVANLCALVAAAYAKDWTSYLPEKLLVGCSLLGCADGSCMRDDGTYPLSSGLLTRLTLRQMLHDTMAPKEAILPVVKLEYIGLLGKHAHMDATLVNLLQNVTVLTKFLSVQLSDKSASWAQDLGVALLGWFSRSTTLSGRGGKSAGNRLYANCLEGV